MAMPKGSITCLLCKGAVSIRSGNMDKFKVHVESDHDVFYDHDILIAINFLEAHEKEIIIEKVLPRMRVLFDNVRSLNGRLAIGDKLNIEKRLLGNAEESQAKKAKLRCKADDDLNEVDATTSEIDSSIELSDRSQEEIKLVDDSEDEDSNYVNKLNDDDSEEENDAVSVGETLAESIQSIRDIFKDNKDEFTDCDVCHQSVRKSIFEFHRKSHLSAAKTAAECDICRKVMQKKSLYKHKRRCHILNTSRQVRQNDFSDDTIDKNDSVLVVEPAVEATLDVDKLPEELPSTADESQCYICKKPMLKGNIRRHIRMVHGSELDFKCKICFTGFQKLESLKWHTTKEHNLDLDDVEQMLQENSDQSEQTQNVENITRTFLESSHANVKLDPDILEKVIKGDQKKSGDKVEDVDVKKYKCEQCDNEYTNKDSVRRHKRKAHPKIVGHPSI